MEDEDVETLLIVPFPRLDKEQDRLISQAMQASLSKAYGQERNRLVKEHGIQKGLFSEAKFHEEPKILLTPKDLDTLFERAVESMPEFIKSLHHNTDLFHPEHVTELFNRMSPEEKRAVFDRLYPEALEHSCAFPTRKTEDNDTFFEPETL